PRRRCHRSTRAASRRRRSTPSPPPRGTLRSASLQCAGGSTWVLRGVGARRSATASWRGGNELGSSRCGLETAVRETPNVERAKPSPSANRSIHKPVYSPGTTDQSIERILLVSKLLEIPTFLGRPVRFATDPSTTEY